MCIGKEYVIIVSLKHNLIENSAVGLIYFRLVFPNPLLIYSEKMCKSGEYFLINSLNIEHAMNLRSTSYSMVPAVPQSTSQKFEANMCQVPIWMCIQQCPFPLPGHPCIHRVHLNYMRALIMWNQEVYSHFNQSAMLYSYRLNCYKNLVATRHGGACLKSQNLESLRQRVINSRLLWRTQGQPISKFF